MNHAHNTSIPRHYLFKFQAGENLEAFMDEQIRELNLERPMTNLPPRKRKRIMIDENESD